MKSATIKVKCIGCKLGNTVAFALPGFFTPTIVNHKCENCESELLIKLSRYKSVDKKPGQVNVGMRIIKMSPLLLEIIKEEEALAKTEPSSS